MLIYTKIDKEKSVINSAATFCAAAEKIGIYNTQFSLIFEYAEKLIKTENPSVSVSAISNVTGDWYEWLITILGRNFATSTPSNSLLVKLPNVSSFDSTLLYQSQYAELISDFKEKLKITSNVNLVTSNPDFVIMDRALFKSNLHKVEKITPDVLKTLEKDYTNYINSSNLGGIKGYLATKSSLRPDRRIQLLHEGSLMKAIYTHMQTRLWITDAPGIKYFAASLNVGDADKQGLRSVATHSIVSATSKPEPAVDSITKVSNSVEAEELFRSILI